MNKDLLGLGGTVPPGQEEIRLFDDLPDTFATDDPYLLVDGTSLIAPLPATVTDEETYIASDGSLQGTIGAPNPVMPPLNGYPWVLESGNWVDGGYWLIERSWT